MHVLFSIKVYGEDNFQNANEPDAKSELQWKLKGVTKNRKMKPWMLHEFVIKIIHVSMENVNITFYYGTLYRTTIMVPSKCVKKDVSIENR